MGREEFLSELARQLRSLPEAARSDMLLDYEEHFRMGLSKGKTEEAIAQALGSPRHIAAACLTDLAVKRAEASDHMGDKLYALMRACLAVLGLGFFNAVFVLGPFFGLVGLLMGLWATALAPAAAGLAVFGDAVAGLGVEMATTVLGWGHVFLSVGLLAAGALLTLGMAMATKWFATMTLRYIRLNFSIIAK